MDKFAEGGIISHNPNMLSGGDTSEMSKVCFPISELFEYGDEARNYMNCHYTGDFELFMNQVKIAGDDFIKMILGMKKKHGKYSKITRKYKYHYGKKGKTK